MRKREFIRLPDDREEKFFGIFIKEKSFYRTFFSLLLVIALQQLAALTVNLVDNIMLGRYSELALSGATLVNQLQFMLSQITAGGGLGIVVLSSRYWGRNETGPIKKIISLGIKTALVVGIIFWLLSMLIPYQLMGLFTSDQAVIDESVRYLRIFCWTYLIFSLSNSLMYAMQSVETAFIGTIMSISTICINLCLNYILIFGHFGAPELGIRGAAIATLISRSVELIICTFYVIFIDKKLHTRFSDLIRVNFEYLPEYFKVSVPVMVSGVLWGLAQAAQTAVLGHIGAEVIAAGSIASIVFEICVVFGSACSNVSSIMIGKTIGSGLLHKVKAYSKTMQGIFILQGIFSGLLIFCLRDLIVSFYAVSDQTREYTLQFLTIMSLAAVGSCYEFPVEGGIIAGGGSTEYIAIADNTFMWLFTIPFACLSAFVWHFSPAATFLFLKADQVLKCLPNAIVCNRYHWVRKLTNFEE